MVSQWSLRGGKLTGMASLIIADGEAPGSERDEFIVKWMDKIVEDRRFDSFNSIRTFINNQEVLTTRIFEAALHRGLTIVADSIDTEYFQDAKAYPQYIQDLYDKGVRVFCVDDANRYTKDQLAAIVKPIYNEVYKGKTRKRRDTYLLLSTAIGTTQAYIEMSRSLSTERIGIEPQMYRSGESTIWIARWFKSYPGIAMPALEAYDPAGKAVMTPLADLKTMGNYFVDNKPDNMSVYGIDRQTNYEDYPDHWDVILDTIDRWKTARIA